MTEMRVEYTGDLRCKVTHGPSGAFLTTDAPKDNEGKGESFSPTDLTAAALGACMLTIVGIVARRKGLDVRGAHATVRKDMVADPLRRIGQITCRVALPASLEAKDRKMLEAAALSCPVHKSLHPATKTPVEFAYE